MDEESNKVKLTSLDFRIPKWDLDELHERHCPICNNYDTISKYVRPDSLCVKFCDICNTYFISPAPSAQQLSDFYANYDEIHRVEANLSISELILAYQDINPLDDYRILTLSNHIQLLNSKVLDVGFGRARFLYSLMKLGAIPFGVELDEKAIKYAAALGIHNVNKGSIEDLSDEIKFNLIILNDLIEHPINPMNVLKKASDLLDSKGLLMIWTPNGEITDNEINPTTFRVDLEHMQYLTPQSCLKIAKEFNLEIVHMETLGFPNILGIEKTPNKAQNFIIHLKKVIKLIPGAQILLDLRNIFIRKLFSIKIKEKKKGAYHLFCIMQKVA